MASFNIYFAWASAMALHAVRAAFNLSGSVALGTLCPRNERSEENTPNTNAQGTTLSGPGVSLHALTAKRNRNSFFSFQ